MLRTTNELKSALRVAIDEGIAAGERGDQLGLKTAEEDATRLYTALRDAKREAKIRTIGLTAEGAGSADSGVGLFLASETFAAYRDSNVRAAGFKTEPVTIEFKAPINPIVANPDDDVQHLRPGIVTPFVYPPRIGALFTQGTMDGSSVSWLDVPSADGNADYTAYGAQKAGPADANVDVHAVKASKVTSTYTVPDEALDDLTGLRAALEQILLQGPAGIGVKVEAQYLAGNGTGTPLQLAGIDSLSPTDVSGNGSNFVSDMFFAALDIEGETGSPATAAVVNPIDYFQIITLEGDDGRPLFAPFGGAYKDPSLGFPIVRSKAVANGTIYVGAWNLSILYTRMATTVRATNEGIGLADKNLTMFVAETRQALSTLTGSPRSARSR
jgi:hypothetical protein